MSDFHARLMALKKAGFPMAQEDDAHNMDMHDITEGMKWMAGEISILRDALWTQCFHFEQAMNNEDCGPWFEAVQDAKRILGKSKGQK